MTARRAILLAALIAPACAAPPPPPAAPGPAPARRPAAVAVAPAPPPAPTVAEAPLRAGDPALVLQRGLHSFASVVRVARSGLLAAVVDGGPDVRLFDPRTAEERGILRGHAGRVNDVDLAPAGDRLVSAADDRTARLWDLTTGAELATFFRGGLVYHARFSPDGRTIATSHPDGVRLWDATGAPRATLAAPSAELAFRPDGGALVTWERAYDATKEIAVWDAQTGALVYRLPSGTAGLTHREAAWSPDGALLAWTDGARAVVISDGATGAVLRTIPTARKPGRVAFAPDGRHLAVVNEKLSVSLHEVATGRLTASMRTDDAQRFAFAPDGRRVAIEQGDDLEVRAVPGGGVLARLRGGDSGVTSFAFTPDGARVVGGAGIHTPDLVVWDAGSGARTAARRRARFERRVAWGGDGRVLASLGAGGGTPASRWENVVRLWDADTGALRLALRRPEGAPLRSDYHRLAVSADGARVAAANMETATLWDAHTGQFLADLDQDKDFRTEHGVAFQPKGKLLATTGGKRAEVRLWDATTGKKVRAFPSGLPVAWSVAFRPDGAVVAVVGAGRIALLDVRTGARIRSMQGPPGGVFEVAWAPDGKALVVTSGNRGVHLFDAASGAPLGAIPTRDGRVYRVAVSADGSLVATAGDDGLVEVFRLPAREPVATLPARDAEEASDVAFHPRLPALVAARGAIEVVCAPTSARVSLQPVAAGDDLAGLAYDDAGHFGGDPAAAAGLRFRVGPDARLPLVPAAAVERELARPRLVGDLVAGCAAR